ncbi:MAG: hypothetical protein MRY83_25145 [Flavobacteriales bacterium]|nr:hypothetical protein [Flavobacteriales bacterium]
MRLKKTKQIIQKLSVVLFISLSTICTYGSHLAGGDLLYERLPNGDFRVTLTIYRDCSGQVIQENDIAQINARSSCFNSENFNIPRDPSRTTFLTLDCSGSSNCNGGQSAGIEVVIYEGVISLPGACNDWILSFNRNARNNNIDNINNGSGGGDFHIESMLNNTISNSSPTFSNAPFGFLCQNQNFSFNHGATDSDGDVLQYSFTDPLEGINDPVNWTNGYDANNFVVTTSTPPTIDQNTGAINFTPQGSQTVIGAVRVEEWRNGQLIGYVTRDLQFNIGPYCSNNTLPTASGVDGSTNYNLTICPDEQACFNIKVSDNDNDDVFVSWNNGIPAGTFSVSNNNSPNPNATFCWTPTATDISSTPYVFTVTVQDDHCPINGTQVFTYSIIVDDAGCVSAPCEDCIGSFAPTPGKKYILEAWSKQANAGPTTTNYDDPEISLNFQPSGSVGPFKPSGIIIDGWQRIEEEFVIPVNATQLSLNLGSAGGDVYFDDIRIYPFDGNAKSYVYDPVSLRLVAELDERNYATFYEYDEEGKLTRVKKETERGVMTIQETRTHIRKQ